MTNDKFIATNKQYRANDLLMLIQHYFYNYILFKVDNKGRIK